MNDTIGEITVILLAFILAVLAVVFVVPFPFAVIGWAIFVIAGLFGAVGDFGYFGYAGIGFSAVIVIALVRALLGKD